MQFTVYKYLDIEALNDDLSLVVKEAPVAEVCEAYKVARGMVQALQENAGRFASMVSVFCERLGWHDLEGLVGKFQNRVSFGVRAEIVELTNIPYVKASMRYVGKYFSADGQWWNAAVPFSINIPGFDNFSQF